MKGPQAITSIGLLLLCIVISSCTSSISETSSTTASTITTYYSDRIIDLTIDNYDQTALIAINTSTSTGGTAESAGITPLQSTHTLSHISTDPSHVHYFMDTTLFNQNSYPTQAPTTVQPQQLATDSPPVFNIAYNGSLNTQVTQSATLSYVGTSCNIYVQTSKLSTSLETHINVIGNYCDSTIYTQALTHLATPYDIDNNGKTIVYVGDIGNSGLMGYFYRSDFFNSTSIYTSNQADIIYLNISSFESLNASSPDYTDIYHVLAHEYQHLINFSQRYRQYETDNNDSHINQSFSTWIEEGIAEGTTPYLTNNDVTLSSYFSSSLANTSILNGLGLFSWNSSFYDYVLSFTFLEYCRIQSNQTQNFYSTLMNNFTQSNTYPAVYSIIQSADSTLFSDINDVVLSYRIANLINDSSGKYGYQNNYSMATLSSPSTTSPSIEPGGAIYYTSTVSNNYNSFIPADVGDNIYYYRINDTGD